MLRLAGIPVTDADAKSLVATLTADGGDDALKAAWMINRAIERGLYTVGLTPEMSDAILAVLENPAEGLAELRDALARDHRNRPDAP